MRWFSRHGIRVEVLADDGVVVPGQPIKLSIVAGNNGPADVAVKSVQFAGFVGDAPACAGAVQSGSALTCASELHVGPAALSTPYWTPRKDAARYDFEPGVPFGLPFRPTPFRATLAMSIGGADVSMDRIVEYRYSDLFAGEKRMELQVVPPFDVRVAPDIAVVPTPAAPHRIAGQPLTHPVVHTRTVEVTVSNNEKGPVAAMASLHCPTAGARPRRRRRSSSSARTRT